MPNAPRGHDASETQHRLIVLRSTPQTFRTLLAGHPKENITWRPRPDAWSVTEIVCHLRDVEEFYLDRVRVIVANHDPVLTAFEPERWAIERQYARCACLPALDAFAGRRKETLAVLDALGNEAWERGGAHPLRGWMTVRRIVHGWAKHDIEHADQVRRALAGQP